MSSFGEDLKRERELRKISLREIAESTKINVRYLDALENNDFKRLPGGVFNKGFVRAYAEHIGVDEEAMVNAYLLEEQAQHNRNTAPEGETLRGNYGDRFTLAVESLDDPPSDRRRKGIVLAAGAVLAVIILLVVGWMLYGKFWKDDPVQAVPPAPQEIEAISTEKEDGVIEPLSEDTAGDEEQAETVVAKPPVPEPVVVPKTETPTAPAPLKVEITLARPTNGRLNCDNRHVEMLDRLAAGVTLGFLCDRFLLIDADDGGALLISRSGGEQTPAAEDGVKLRQYRLTPDGEAE
ncbi:MAG: helix-turn-helix domain-containing protein [Acidobacteria bacterium]|uniref:Helix-turn-helix domain-containing protein n=1 Tax=Candidatus Polarisedimenticola svalbardensis TaxID=2886004 RepID=A0A8J7C247_9BACT|nr:helix-turn-helix domain-containing protein [Candidatus Polarisedimenticola svalbardensis]